MKRFLVTSALLFLGAIVAVAVVFFIIMFSGISLKEKTAAVLENAVETGGAVVEKEVTEVADSVASSTTAVTESTTYALKDFALSETEKDLLTAAGIDPETFIITEAMVACVKQKVGQERFDAIVAGDTPGFLEMTRVIPCLQ
jgi:hypothetical protein